MPSESERLPIKITGVINVDFKALINKSVPIFPDPIIPAFNFF